MAVAFRGVGALSIGAAGVTPVISPSVVADDIMLLLVETANQAVTVANQNGGTWTEIPDSPQGQGTAGAAGGVRLTVFWSRHNGTQGNPTTSDSGEHNAAMVIGYSGCITSGDPFDVTAGDVQAATTAGSIPGDTTTVDGCMIVAMAATDRDSSGSANASGWTNASLVSITERFDETSATGTGGGFAVADGIKTTAGVVDATTWTQAASAALCNIMIALKPPSAAAVVTPAAVTVTSAAPTPTISAASNVLASVLLVVASLGTPAIATAGNVAPTAVTAAVTLPTPSILFGATVTPATVATAAILDTPFLPVVTLVRDSVSERTNFTSTSPATSSHTPVGTPQSVTVFIAHGTVSTDLITGPVTYGGVAMTRVPTNGFAQDTSSEAGAVYAYHLGSGIPTGTQTLSISHNGASTTKWAVVVYHGAATSTTIVTSGKLEGDQANPQLALDTGSTQSIRVCVLYSGSNAITGFNALTGMEVISIASSVDFGTFIAIMGQQTNASVSSFTVGFNGATDDVAFIALAIQEAVGGNPATVTAVATLPTPTVIGGISATVTPATVTTVATLPASAIPTDVQAATVAVNVTIPTPAITLSATVLPVTSTATVTLPTPAIAAAAKATPTVTARAVTLPTPTVVGGISATVTPATIGGDYLDQYGDPYSGGLVVSIPTPTILATSTATPATVTVVATLPTPTVTVAVTVNPAAIAAVVDLPTPTVVGGVSAVVTPATVSILSTVPDPSVAAGFTATPATVTTAATFPTATVQAGSTVVSAAVAVVAAFPPPTVTAAATVTSTVIPLTVTIPTPGLLVGVGALVLPDTVGVTATLPTPLISVPVSVTPATVLAVVTVPTSTVVGGVSGSVTPTAVAATTTLPTPSLNAGAEVTPVTVLASVTLPTPTAGVDAAVTPATVTVVVDVPTPATLAAVLAAPSTVTVTVAVPTPLILGPTTAGPLTVIAVTTLPTPTVIIGALFPPGFWSPDPIGYVKNPVGYTKVGPDDDPPW